MNIYTIGTKIQLAGDFTNSAGVLTDPTSVTVKVKEPDDAVLTLNATKTTVGKYTADFIPSKEGLHSYRFEGTGACQAAGEQTFMTQTVF